MAKCQYCEREMTAGISCTYSKIKINDKVHNRLNSGFFEELGEPDTVCHDCGIHNDGKSFHHYGCDMEICPSCGHQIISCDCKKQELIP